MSLVESIEKLLCTAKAEEIRLKAGVKCAGPQLRKHLMEISRQCTVARKDALEQVRAIPSRNRKEPASAEETEQEPEIEEDPEEKKEAASSPELATLELKKEELVVAAVPDPAVADPAVEAAALNARAAAALVASEVSVKPKRGRKPKAA